MRLGFWKRSAHAPQDVGLLAHQRIESLDALAFFH